jgi:predicted flap endonuclease-1-like 5' DNA nuclease
LYSLFFRVVALFLTLPLPSPISSQVLRVPWFEWRDDLRREEKAEYLAHLLYRDAGLTLKDATVVPGGVLMSRRVEGDDAPGSPEMRAAAARRDGSSSTGGGVSSSTSATMSDAEVDSLFDDIAEDVGLGGMEAFVARVKSDGGNIRVNRTGGVVVEGAEASDEEEVKLRNTRFGDRLRSRPGATMGFADGPKNDVAPYGMNLESGGGRKGYRPARGRVAGGGVGGGSSSTASRGSSGSSSGSSPGSASGSSPGLASGSASETKPRAASVARRSAAGTAGSGTASPGTGASRGVPVRRRRVRVSVPNGNDAAARGRALGRSSPASRAAGSTSNPASTSTPTWTPASDSSSTGASRSASRSASSSIGGLKGVGPGSVAALEGLGVRTVEELAALSDAAVSDIKSKKPLLKVSSLRKIARRAMEDDGEGR